MGAGSLRDADCQPSEIGRLQLLQSRDQALGFCEVVKFPSWGSSSSKLRRPDPMPAMPVSRPTSPAAPIGRASAPGEFGVHSVLDIGIAAVMDDPSRRGAGGDPAAWSSP